MKLWLLEAVTLGPKGPWRGKYDMNYGFVIRARSEEDARALASASFGDEGKDAWTDPKYSSCIQLKDIGNPGVIISDYHAG
jgi:hypothetical protein